MLFFTIGAIYLVYLVYLLIRAYSELRAMPYFGKRLNFFFFSYSNSQWKAQFLFIAVTTNSLLYTDLYFQYCETEMATTSNSCKHTNSVPMVQSSMHWNWSVSNLIRLWVNALVAIACEAQTHFRSSLLYLRKIASANPSSKTISMTWNLFSPYHVHSLRSRCFIKKSSFNVAGNLVIVVKFTFQSVFGNSRQNPRHASARGREGARELYSILWSDWPTSKQKVHVMEIVLLLGFADAIFRR